MKFHKLFFIALCFCLLGVDSAHAFFGLFGDSNIQMVRNGTFSFDKSITLGDALEGNQHLVNPEWSSFEDSQGRVYVDFKSDVSRLFLEQLDQSRQEGDFIYVPAFIKMQFVLNRDKSFFPTSIEYGTEFGSFVKDSLHPITLENFYRNTLPPSFGMSYLDFQKNFLTNAYKENNVPKIKLYLERVADKNFTPFGHQQRLFNLQTAMNSGVSIEILQLLLNSGLDINDEKNKKALEVAIRRKNTEYVKFLLENKAEVNTYNRAGIPAIIDAVNVKNIDIIKLMLDYGVDLEAKNRNGETALWIAVKYNYDEIVELLLKNGANSNVKDNHQTPILLQASNYGKISIIQLLLDYGADINVKNSSGRTALFVATERLNENLVLFYLENGIDASIVDNDGRRAVDIAYHDEKIKEILLVFGNSQEKGEGNTQKITLEKHVLDDRHPFVIEDSEIAGGISLEYFDTNKFNLFLQISERSADRWSCSFSVQCIENNGKFVCEDVEDGNLEGIFLGETITVIVEPIGMCGLNGSMLGKYVYQELDDDY